MSKNLTPEDMSVIAIFWLTLSNLGFVVQDLDLSEPGYIQRMGPHTVYTFSVRLRDDLEFPEERFCSLMNSYCKISPVKPHCYGIETYPAHGRLCFDTQRTKAKTVPLKNFHEVYVSVYL